MSPTTFALGSVIGLWLVVILANRAFAALETRVRHLEDRLGVKR